MADQSESACALCAAGKVVLQGKRWPEHRVLLKHDGDTFEFHVRCTPRTPSQAALVREVKKNLKVAPRKGMRRVGAPRPGK